MRRLTAILLFTAFAGSGSLLGQQLPQFTQYMFNDYVINPAIAGTQNYFQIRTNHRFQWVGMTDPPLTNSIAFYGPSEKRDMGYGGYIYNDVTGPTSRTGVTGSYAYNIAIRYGMRLSMGISFTMLQYRVDGTQLNPKDASDPSILNMVSTSYMPDAGLGAYLYDVDKFYVGLSMAQLLNNKAKIFDNKDGLNRLKTHINLTGGYRYEINPDWALEPSVMIKGTAPKEISFDITAKVNWQKMVWGAVSYRYHDVVAIMIGYSYEETFIFGYAYDIGINSIRKYNTGTHELMIGYRFNDVK
ncbi:MAG: type IX secretion system membrane protein PorP/SprF [Bacteroidetes bacterium]|nr:type IX secretion system membrane protein PorP/SprF [Bacteroidota bacterium]